MNYIAVIHNEPGRVVIAVEIVDVCLVMTRQRREEDWILGQLAFVCADTSEPIQCAFLFGIGALCKSYWSQVVGHLAVRN